MSPEELALWHFTSLADVWSAAPVMGCDMSYSAAGIAVLAGSIQMTRALTPPKNMRGAERLEWFRDEIRRIASLYHPVLAFIEDYAFDSKWGREQAGELGGVTRLALHDEGVAFETVAISSLKKFSTGIGSGKKVDKGLVARELFRRYGVDALGNDEVDAAGLSLMAAARIPGSKVPMNADQIETLAKVGAPKPPKRRRVTAEK